MKAQLKIKFNKKLYQRSVLAKTIRAFSELAAFGILEKDGYYIVAASRINPAVSRIFKDEFCNYALAIMKNQKNT